MPALRVTSLEDLIIALCDLCPGVSSVFGVTSVSGVTAAPGITSWNHFLEVPRSVGLCTCDPSTAA